jgi:hypothetical protein
MKLSGAEQNLCVWVNYIQEGEGEREITQVGWKKEELCLIVILGLVIPKAPARQYLNRGKGKGNKWNQQTSLG